MGAASYALFPLFVGGALGMISRNLIRDLKQDGRSVEDPQSLTGAASSSDVQQAMDAFIAQEKEKRGNLIVSGSLPLPLRFSSEQISNLRYSWIGGLRFDASYDSHHFKFAVQSRSAVKGALSAGGWLL